MYQKYLLKYRKRKPLQIPLVGLAALVSGFYIGFNESQGVDVRNEIEYLTKFGQTILAVVTSRIFSKYNYSFKKRFTKNFRNGIEDGSLGITFRGQKKPTRYDQLDSEEFEEVSPILKEDLENLESKLQPPKNGRTMLNAGVQTAVATGIGYVAGSLCGKLV